MSDDQTRITAPHPVRDAAGTTTVTLHGEIDVLSAAPLRRRLDALSAAPRPDLVLDLRSVSFIDCAGLAELCRVRNRVRARRGRLRLVTGSRRFLWLLRATGLRGVFDVHPDLPREPAGGPARDGSTGATAAARVGG